MYPKDKTVLKTGSGARSSLGNSSILKKSSSIKRRLTELVQTPTKVRFQLPHSRQVRNILEAYVSSNETKEYLSLICLIRDAQLLDSDLSSLISEATECISLLNRDLRLFVEALLAVNWLDRGSDVVKQYQSFIVNLISAHNYHAKYVIDKLVGLFLPNPKDPEWPDGKITDADLPKCLNIHVVIKILLDVIPMCKDLLLQSFNKQYPYYNKPTHSQEYYLYNLLMVLSYQPQLRPDILHLVFSKLIIMDVNAPKEELLKAAEEDDDEIFQMEDCDSKSVKTIQTTFTVVNRSSLGVALDVCMNKMFEFIVKECKGDDEEPSWDNIKSIYHDVLAVFDKVILPTYSSLHVQFVMFLLCSLKPAVTEAFLHYLWKKVCNPNLAIVLRQAAVTYIASLVARGLFVSLPVVKETMRHMAEWIHAYIASQDSLDSVNSDVRVHTVFYSVCQALFYLVSFRHKDLVDRKKNIIFLASLQLGKMVTSRLNPLRVCQPAVVKNFAAVTRKYQLAYCYTILDRNARNCMPTIHQDEKGAQVVSDHVLSDFYPFDPYVLQLSGEKIQPHYREYQEKPQNHSSMEVDQRQHEIDDFLEFTETLSASPNASQKVHNFSYSSSPGFKFIM